MVFVFFPFFPFLVGLEEAEEVAVALSAVRVTSEAVELELTTSAEEELAVRFCEGLAGEAVCCAA